MLRIKTESTQETIDLGRKLGILLESGNIVTLIGDLGVGKTHFSKGVALGLGVQEHITSPTFTIVNEYESKIPFYHIDAYRLNDVSEAEDIGIEEYLFGSGVTLIEWPQILFEVLPKELLEIEILKDSDDENARFISFTPTGKHYEQILRELTK